MTYILFRPGQAGPAGPGLLARD